MATNHAEKIRSLTLAALKTVVDGQFSCMRVHQGA